MVQAPTKPSGDMVGSGCPRAEVEVEAQGAGPAHAFGWTSATTTAGRGLCCSARPGRDVPRWRRKQTDALPLVKNGLQPVNQKGSLSLKKGNNTEADTYT